MLLSIAVQFVDGKADYLLKENMPILRILLAAADFHLFGKLNESLCGTRFEDDVLVNAAK